MAAEHFKIALTDQMRSFASLLLEVLIEARLQANSTGPPTGSSPHQIVAARCHEELVLVSSSALRNEPWALKVFDANGRLRSGLASGSLFNAIGNYAQCVRRDPESRLARANNFCLVHLDLSQQVVYMSQLFGLPRQLLAPPGGRSARLGVCVPSSCRAADVRSLGGRLLGSVPFGAAVSLGQLTCESAAEPSAAIGLAETLFVVLALSVASALVYCTLLGARGRRRRQSSQGSRSKTSGQDAPAATWRGHLSLAKAWARLFAARAPVQAGPRAISLKVLDGLRVLSMLWIITTHSYNFATEWLFFDNIAQVGHIYRSVWTQWIGNATLAMDNFFLMSGLLAGLKHVATSHQQEQQAQQERKEQREAIDLAAASAPSSHLSRVVAGWKASLAAIAARYSRLMPALLFVLLGGVALLPRLARGPNSVASIAMFNDWCHKNWPVNLLMMQNLINTSNICLSHSWYVAAEFQLFVLFQLILAASSAARATTTTPSSSSSSSSPPPQKSPTQLGAWSLLLAPFMLAAQLYVFVAILIGQLPAMPLFPVPSLQALVTYYSTIYIKPFYWTTSYAIGLLLAVKLGDSARRCPPTRQARRTVTWSAELSIRALASLPLALMLLIVLSSMPFFLGHLPPTSLLSSVYAALVRPLWSTCLAFAIYMAVSRDGPLARRGLSSLFACALSSNVWLPLSRLTYSAYLIHPLVMAAFYGSREETFEFSHLLLFYFCIGNTAITLVLSLGLNLLIEQPAQYFAKLMLGGQSSKSPEVGWPR